MYVFHFTRLHCDGLHVRKIKIREAGRKSRRGGVAPGRMHLKRSNPNCLKFASDELLRFHGV